MRMCFPMRTRSWCNERRRMARYKPTAHVQCCHSNCLAKMEADYLKRTVGTSLAEGLAEVAANRPSDPIDYLAQWLLKHKQNILRQQQDGPRHEHVLHKQTAIEQPVESEAVPTADEETSHKVVLQVETQVTTEPEEPPPAETDSEAAATKLTRIEEETTEELEETTEELDKEEKQKEKAPDSKQTEDT